MNNVKKLIMLFAFSIVLTSASAIQAQTVQAQEEQPTDQPPTDQQPCTVDFEGIPLTVGDKQWAEAEYAMDENCQPVLVATRRGRLPLPDDKQAPGEVVKGPDRHGQFSPQEAFSLSPTAPMMAAITNTCTTETWETDFAFLRTVTNRNKTRYTWTGSGVTSWTVTPSVVTHFSWWFVSAGPFVSVDTSSLPSNLTTKTWATFYCNGGPFCSGGPLYFITLFSRDFMTSSGGCTGLGTYSGTVIPGGHVFQRTWKS